MTGGTSGIGLATVERFVAEGARVMIANIQEDAEEFIAYLAETRGSRVRRVALPGGAGFSVAEQALNPGVRRG